MANNHATATWKGALKSGSGDITAQSNAFHVSYDFNSRFGDANEGSNPEELVAAAHAACFSMFLASLVEKGGHAVPEEIKTTATVALSKDDRGPFISSIKLATEARIPGMKQHEFEQYADTAKQNCPLSRALNAVSDITVNAMLK